MALPISILTDAILRATNSSAVAMWNTPKNPLLAKLYEDSVQLEGYTPNYKFLPITQDVVHIPVASEFASPRMQLPRIDGTQEVLRSVLPFELQAPMSSPTIDEWETAQLSLMLIGATRQSFKSYAAERMAIRLALALNGHQNRLEVITADLYRTCAMVTGDTYAAKVTNSFARKAAATVGDLDTNLFGYADMSSGGLTGRRWVNGDGTLNSSATPVNDVNAMVATMKYYGGGGVKYFVSTQKSIAAYAADFKTNFAELADKTVLTTVNAAIQIPSHLERLGWTLIGYFYLEAENWRPVPVFGGNNIKYRDWADNATTKTLLSSTEHFVFPVSTMKVFSHRWTHVDVQRLADSIDMNPVNLYPDNKTGSIEGEVLHRGYIYPNVNPNAIVYWRVG